MTEGTKLCSRCKTYVPIEQIGWTDKAHTKRKSICKTCDAKKQAAYLEKHPEARQRHKEIARNWYLKHGRARQVTQYGLTLEQYDVLVDQQQNRCAICGGPPGEKRLHVDHDHKTGKVRALLCSNCNCAIGYMHDDVELLAKAIAYLTQHKEH